jgi:tRNA uridine 5-carbamoylmethylation protein Kti12
MRREAYVLARDGGAADFIVLHVKTALSTALERNASRTGQDYIDPEVIHRIYKQFEPPNADYVYDRVSMDIDTSSIER